jgi:hypothetical protein
LLKKGYLKADEEYGYKCTLLHYAALRGCRMLTALLLSKEADLHAVNSWGKQPLDYARRFEQEYSKFSPQYLYRGKGVEVLLEDCCYKKHIRPQKITQECGSPCLGWTEFSQEEAAWLARSCIYSLK